jgi:hypothetical protein
VPLNRDGKVVWSIEFDGLDHSIVRRDGRNKEIVANGVDGLVVARVDPLIWLAWRNDCGQARTRLDFDGVGIDDRPARAVIHIAASLRGQVLEKCAIAPDVETLSSMTDPENRFAQAEGVLQKKFVNRGAAGIGGTAFGETHIAIALGFDVVTAAGQEDSLHRSEKFGDAVLALVERPSAGQLDRMAASAGCTRCRWT